MKRKAYVRKPRLILCRVCEVKAFADYPYCEKHTEIYEAAEMQKRQMQETG
jgi:hypothetical protein